MILRKIAGEARLAKNQRIKENGLKTRERRKNMSAKTVDLKIVSSSLSKKQREALNRLFLEYKWLRNQALASERFDLEYLKEIGNKVQVKMPDGTFEERVVEHLGSQMKQQVISELNQNLRALSALKKKGYKVGRLKFVSEVNSINLPQFGVTYRLYANGRGDYSKIKIQNVPRRIRVRGFHQLCIEGIEFANAKLVRRPDGFHLLVTIYVPKVVSKTPESQIGVDFGVKTSFTLSDESKVNAIVEENERLRRLHRKLSRQQKGSNGYRKTLDSIKKEYCKMDYRKNELARQLVHQWTSDSVVFFQDENISSWKRRNSISRGSRKVQHGVLGRVKSLLRRSSNAIMLPSWVATTAWCYSCGSLTKHDVSSRIFVCGHCSFSEDRDIHAAKNMILLGKRYNTLTSGTEGSAGGASIRLKEQLYAVTEQLAAKP